MGRTERYMTLLQDKTEITLTFVGLLVGSLVGLSVGLVVGSCVVCSKEWAEENVRGYLCETKQSLDGKE